MNLLILDAEIVNVRKIKKMIVWKNFGITDTITAYSVEKAKELLEKNKIDLIICEITSDAEKCFMLLEWAKNLYSSLEIILLGETLQHQYFRKALHLGVIDHVPKEAAEKELLKAMTLFQKRIQTKKEVEMEIQGGKYWKQNQTLIQQMFWKNLFLNRIQGGLEKIEEEAVRANVGLELDSAYAMVLIAMKNHDEMWSKWGEDFCQAAIQNVARSIFKKRDDDSKVMVIYSRVAILLDDVELDSVETKCWQLINACKEELGAEIFCYISEPVYYEELAGVYSGLFAYSKGDVLRREQVKFVKKGRMKENQKIIVPKIWGDILYTCTPLDLVQEVRTFLTDLAQKGLLSEETFQLFQQDMLQMFFAYMEKKELSTHELYDNNKIFKLYKAAISSIDDMCCWIQACTEYITKGILNNKDNTNKYMVAIIKEFIWTHMKEEITVPQIAEEVHLSADYMTKLLKKETGLTTKEYMIKRRLEKAKELLRSSDKTVSDIALEIGYDNLSYFIRKFRMYYGVTPKQYQLQKDELVIKK